MIGAGGIGDVSGGDGNDRIDIGDADDGSQDGSGGVGQVSGGDGDDDDLADGGTDIDSCDNDPEDKEKRCES